MTEMKAGRELDALVAEEVMGLDPEWHKQVPVGRVTPCYSTDIAAAWEVVEKLCREERYPTVQFAVNVDGKQAWWCSLVNPADVEVHAPAAPLAVCLAALKAVGVDIE